MLLFELLGSIHKKKRKACENCRPLDIGELLLRFSDIFPQDNDYFNLDVVITLLEREPNFGKLVLTFIKTYWRGEKNELLSHLRRPCVSSTCIGNKKSANVGKDYRSKGNDAFTQNFIAKAQDFYTMAILFSPKDSEELALAYGNRSAAYMRRGFFEHAIADCDSAIEAGHKHRSRLLYRKAEALVKMKRFEEADQLMSQIENRDYEKELELKELRRYRTILGLTPNWPHIIGPICWQPPTMSAKVKILKNNTQGVHAIAKKKLLMGEMIIDESAYASTFATFSYEHRHCHHCKRMMVPDNAVHDATYARKVHPVPCPECINVLYCCRQCQIESWQQYHRYECRYLDLIYFPSEHLHLALRSLLITKLSTIHQVACQNRTPDLKVPKVRTGPTEWVKEPMDEVFSHIFKMKINWEETPSVERWMLFRHILFLAIFLIESGYIEQKLCETFGERYAEVIDSDEWTELIMGMLFRLVLQTRTHAQPMKRMSETMLFYQKSPVWKYDCSLFATGLFPVKLKYFNHACKPNATVYIEQNNRLLLRANKTIQPGEEITFAYNCHHFSVSNVHIRRELIHQTLFFSCTCSQCRKELQFWDILGNEDKYYRQVATSCNHNLYFEPFHCGHDSRVVPLQDNNNSCFVCLKCGAKVGPEFLADLLVDLCSLLRQIESNQNGQANETDKEGLQKLRLITKKTLALTDKIDEKSCPPLRALLNYCSQKAEREAFEKKIVSETLIEFVVRISQIDIAFHGKLSPEACCSAILWYNLQWEFESQKENEEGGRELMRLKKFGDEMLEIYDAITPDQDEEDEPWTLFYLFKHNIAERIQI